MLQRDPSLQSWQESVNETTGGKVGLAEKGTLQKPSSRKLGAIRQDRVERRESLQKQEAITEVDSSEDETDEGSEDSQEGKRLDRAPFGSELPDPFTEENKPSSKLEIKDSIEDDAFLPEEPKTDHFQKGANQQPPKNVARTLLISTDESRPEVCLRTLSIENSVACEPIKRISEPGTAAVSPQGDVLELGGPIDVCSKDNKNPPKETRIIQKSTDCPEQVKCLPVGPLQLGQGDCYGWASGKDNLKESRSIQTTYVLSQDTTPWLALASCPASISSPPLICQMSCKDTTQKQEFQSTKESICVQNMANFGKTSVQRAEEPQGLSSAEATSKQKNQAIEDGLSLRCPLNAPTVTPNALPESGKAVWAAHSAKDTKDMLSPVHSFRTEVEPGEELFHTKESTSKQGMQAMFKKGSDPETDRAFRTGSLIDTCASNIESESPSGPGPQISECSEGTKGQRAFGDSRVPEALDSRWQVPPSEDQPHSTSKESTKVPSGSDSRLNPKKETALMPGKSREGGDQSGTRDFLFSDNDAVKKT